ncbi:MAG: clostripain-related cysteine peptidase, partial [Candidatus Thermoplasmatota archaeon]
MQYKYIISFLLFIFIAILFILLNAKAEKEWTVMIYASTDSDLHEEGSYVVELLGYIGSSNKVDFIILYDGDQRNDTRAYYVPKSSWFGSSGLKSIPLNEITNNLVNPNEANMGNPLVARDFIKYTINKYPSKKYAIVFWGHAGGGGGFAKDSGDNDKITVPEIQIILSPIKSILGRNLDVFAISSCWAGTAENFYE